MTAGLMGWMGIAIKPSTVLVFSVALGIAIDITIRFLVNYKQELPHFNGKVHETVVQTIRETGNQHCLYLSGIDCRVHHFRIQWIRQYTGPGMAYFLHAAGGYPDQLDSPSSVAVAGS